MADFRFYEKDGKRYDRWSTIANYFPHPRLVEWKVKVGAKEVGRISRIALKIGARVDELCSQDIDDSTYQIDKREAKAVFDCMAAWEVWKERFEPRIVGRQIVVINQVVDVGGTLDIEEHDCITDIKSSAEISRDHWLQTAFYNWTLGLERGKCWAKDYIGVLDLSKSGGGYEYQRREMNQGYIEIIKGMVNKFRYSNSEKELWV